MDDHRLGRAPDFTNAAITMMGVNLMWVFFVIWMLWGFVPVIMLALAINHFAEKVAERRGITPAFARVRLSRTGDRDPQA